MYEGLMGKPSQKAHAGAAEVKMLLFEPESLVIVKDGELVDDRVKEGPSEAFIRNVDHYGVRQSITVRKNSETGKSEVVDGRMRLMAAIEVNKRRKKRGEELLRIPARPARGTAGDLVGLMISLNEQRVADTPMNKAKKAARMLELGKTEEEIAIAFGVSSATVKNLMALIDAPAAVRNAVESGKISTSDGYKLAKLEPEQARKKVAELVEHAPRTPGKKRSPNAKKAKTIVSGVSVTVPASDLRPMRGFNSVENVAREIVDESDHLSQDGKDAIWAFKCWLLYETDDLSPLVGIKEQAKAAQ